jgi:hypothetical protein
MVERQIRRNPAGPGAKTPCRIKSRMRPVHFPERLRRQIFGNLAVTHDSHNPAAYLTLKLVEQRLERVVLAPRKPLQKFHFVLYFLLLAQYEYRYIYLLGAKYRRIAKQVGICALPDSTDFPSNRKLPTEEF